MLSDKRRQVYRTRRCGVLATGLNVRLGQPLIGCHNRHRTRHDPPVISIARWHLIYSGVWHHFIVGIDVSLQLSSRCVLDAAGKVVRRPASYYGAAETCSPHWRRMVPCSIPYFPRCWSKKAAIAPKASLLSGRRSSNWY